MMLIMLFVVVFLIGFNIDSCLQLKKTRTELDNTMIDEIIRLLKIWNQQNEIFCEQIEHDRNNNTPTLNYNMSTHEFRSWLDQEINKVRITNKVWRCPFYVDLQKRIQETFDVKTCEYISNCFPSLYYPGDVA